MLFMAQYPMLFYFLPDIKILHFSILKAFADHKIFVGQMIICFFFQEVENSFGNKEIPCHYLVLLFSYGFQKLPLRVVPTQDCSVNGDIILLPN